MALPQISKSYSSYFNPKTKQFKKSYMFFRMMNPSILLFLLLSLGLPIAFSASGGRMGGGSFSDESDSSSSSLDTSRDSDHLYHAHSTGFIRDPYHGDWRRPSFPETEVDDDGASSSWVSITIMIVASGGFFIFAYHQYLANRARILIVQVGLSGKADSVQRALNEISNTTNTSSSSGWHHVLTETVLVLLRHSDFFISGHARVKKQTAGESVEKCFKELLTDEREKFDVESLVNVNNVEIKRPLNPRSTKLLKDYIVVTILLAAKGTHELPTIRSIDDMKAALKSLNISSDKLMAVEVLWSPQDENDTLSEEELLENYPLLRPI